MLANVGLYSYSFAFVAYLLLTCLLLIAWRGKKLAGIVIAASAVSSVWAGVMVASYYQPLNIQVLQLAELARNAAWCFCLLQITGLTQANPTSIVGLWRSRPLLLGPVLLLSAAVLAASLAGFTLFPVDEAAGNDLGLALWIAFAIIGLSLIEQLFRNASVDDRWTLKYLCLGLGVIFVYDFYMFADALLFKQLNPDLWNARGVVNGIVMPMLAVAIARNPHWDLGIHISRHVVFHTVTLLGAGFYLMAMAIAGYFIRYYGGDWGGVIQVAFLVGSGGLLIVLLFSDSIRAKLRVLLSKHFFSYKYDYREEWSAFTQTLAQGEDAIPERIVRAIARLVNSPGGSLWTDVDEKGFHELCSWNMPELDALAPSDMEGLVSFTGFSHWVIDLDEHRRDPGMYRGLTLPNSLLVGTAVWLIIPLLFNNKVIGLVLLRKSSAAKVINWEDRDLLKIAGKQAASQLAQHQASQALINARQFEAFNRLSAFVVHDLKNILAQQSLIVSNAARHKNNPEFVDDVIATVENSVKRMTRLMEQMRSGIRGSQSKVIQINPLLREVVQRLDQQKPAPELSAATSEVLVTGDREELSTVFGHIIQNAQEATDDDGSIGIDVEHNGKTVTVRVTDTGCGMDEAFIRDRLFTAFDSTKGLTGMGVGAFESREYLRSLGGDIVVKSTPGTGSEFRIVLPCHTQEQGIQS